LALKYPKEMDNTGHIAIINALPVIKEIATQPIVNGTIQWLVEVLDQSGGHGDNDNRGQYDGGLGIGYMRIYTDSTGAIAGYTWSNHPKSKFIRAAQEPGSASLSRGQRGILIGRLNLGPDY
jgi:hypothetical protein